jgi:hypothetical protein
MSCFARPATIKQSARFFSTLYNCARIRISVSPSLYLYHSGTHLGDFDDFDDNLRGGLQAWYSDCTFTQAGHDGQSCLWLLKRQLRILLELEKLSHGEQE